MNIESIWSEFRTELKAFLHSRLSNKADVDDLLQEILIKAYKNIDTIKSGESIKPWIYQVARNALIDFYRKRATSKELQPEELWYGEDSEDGLHDLEKCVVPFIRALPDDYSELLLSIDIDGQSQKEYAELNNIKYSTLKSRVNKGRNMLRASFEECCHFSLDKAGNIMNCNNKDTNFSKC